LLLVRDHLLQLVLLRLHEMQVYVGDEEVHAEESADQDEKHEQGGHERVLVGRRPVLRLVSVHQLLHVHVPVVQRA